MLKFLPPDVVQACVVAGTTDTRYYRAGRGEPVLLLASSADAAHALFERLPRTFSVIAPDTRLSNVDERCAPSPPPADFTAWMRDFLDALGIRRLSVIADSGFAAGALGLTLIERDRVSGLVILLGKCGDLAVSAGSISDRLGKSGQPLLATRFDLADRDSLSATTAEITAFLESSMSLS